MCVCVIVMIQVVILVEARSFCLEGGALKVNVALEFSVEDKESSS